MNRTWRLWLALSAIVLLAGYAGYRVGAPGNKGDAPVTQTLSIFDVKLNDLQGQPQDLGQWRGKVLVVNYWATWCQPCREEMPGFSRLQDKYRDKGIQFIGISIDDAAKIVEFQKETPVTYPLFIGDIGIMKNSADLGNTRQALPFTAVFDRQGKLAMTKLGRLSEKELEPELLELASRSQ
jgi:thiol-disulfide isomerase/thioredoxin